MTSHANIDPELRALLQEVADDPKARLFHTEIPRPERLVLTGVPHTGLHAAGLTNAERELLRVYREDVAKILRDAAEWTIQQDPLGAAKTSLYPTANRRTHYSDAHELLASLRSRTDRVVELRPDASLASLARVGESVLSSPSATADQLAGLSLRVVPDDAAWIHVGRALVLEGAHRPAFEAFAGVVRRGQTPRVRASALTCAGGIAGRVGAHEAAARTYRLAAHTSGPTPNALLSFLAESILTGDGELALQAAEEVDAQLHAEAPGVSSWVGQMVRRQLLTHAPPPGSEVNRLKHSLMHRVGSTARRVIDALQ